MDSTTIKLSLVIIDKFDDQLSNYHLYKLSQVGHFTYLIWVRIKFANNGNYMRVKTLYMTVT